MKTENHPFPTPADTNASVQAGAERNNLEVPGSRPVSSWARFLNFAIDFSIWLVLAFFTMYLLDRWFPNVSQFTIKTMAYSAMIGLFFAYYFILEKLFQRTLGKYMTRTKVVTLNGEKPGTRALLLRTVYRFIPVDWASYFFRRNGMHDFLSGTKVVRDK